MAIKIVNLHAVHVAATHSQHGPASVAHGRGGLTPEWDCVWTSHVGDGGSLQVSCCDQACLFSYKILGSSYIVIYVCCKNFLIFYSF